MGIGDNKSGLVWFKESRTSVLVIILCIPKNKTKKQPNKIQENKEGEPRNKKITVQSTLFHCINRSEIKTN